MKSILITLALLLVVISGYSQAPYVRAGVGLGLPVASQSIDGNATPYNGSITHNLPAGSTTEDLTYVIKKASYAPLTNLTLAAGMMFNKNIGFELAVTAGSSKQYTYEEYNVTLNNIVYDVTVTNQAKGVLYFNPSLVMQTGDRIKLYSRVGAAIPLRTRITRHEIYTNLPGAGAVQTDNYTWEVRNKFSLGITAAAGVMFRTSDNIYLWGELNALSASLYAKESNLTDVTVDGQSGYLQQVPAEQRKIVYSNNFTAKSGDYFHQPTYSVPFSNLTLQVGVSYFFNEDNSPRKSGRNDVKSRRR